MAAAAPAPSRPFANLVCVVIVDSTVTDAAVRRWLGDSLPVRLASWDNRAYYTAIRRLRPRLIIVLDTTAELAWESGNLIASLFAPFAPTVLSAAAPGDRAAHPRLTIHQLGLRARASIASLDDLILA